MQNHTVVSERQRRHNREATIEMRRWKRDYNALSRAIRMMRNEANTAARAGNVQTMRDSTIALHMLRRNANDMLAKRKGIKTILRCTAYAYAPREMVA